MEPQSFFCTWVKRKQKSYFFIVQTKQTSVVRPTDWSQLRQVVKSTHSRSSQSSTHLEETLKLFICWMRVLCRHIWMIVSLTYFLQNWIQYNFWDTNYLHWLTKPSYYLSGPISQTIKGINPLALSSWMASFKVSPLRENCSSVGRNLILMRVIRPAFSTEECACRITRRKTKTFCLECLSLRTVLCIADLIWGVGHQSRVQDRVVKLLLVFSLELQDFGFPGCNQGNECAFANSALQKKKIEK